MNDIKVSVIIPIYNAEEHVMDALSSVLAQSLKEIEILCFDDGSSDQSSKLVEEAALYDARIVLYKGKNRGVSWCRNRGIDIASGEYVAFLDADDLFPNKDQLEQQYSMAKKKEALICGGSMTENRPEGKFKNWGIENKGFVFDNEGWIEYKDYQFDYGFYRFIYKTSFLKKKRTYFPALSRYQDPPFFVDAMTKARKFYALNKETYLYRVGDSGVSWTTKKTIDCIKGVKLNLRKSLKNNFYDLYYLSFLRAFRDFAEQIQEKLYDNDKRVIRLVKALIRIYDESIIKKSKYFEYLGSIKIDERLKELKGKK